MPLWLLPEVCKVTRPLERLVAPTKAVGLRWGSPHAGVDDLSRVEGFPCEESLPFLVETSGGPRKSGGFALGLPPAGGSTTFHELRVFETSGGPHKSGGFALGLPPAGGRRPFTS